MTAQWFIPAVDPRSSEAGVVVELAGPANGRFLGPGPPDNATSRNNLAGALADQQQARTGPGPARTR